MTPSRFILRSILEGVQRLAAGHYAVWDRAGLRSHRYWSLPHEPTVRRSGSAVERCFEFRNNRIVCTLVGPWPARRWHHPPAKLAYDLFPYIGVIARACYIDIVQSEPADIGFVVMAADAVLIEDTAGRGCGLWRRRNHPRHQKDGEKSNCHRGLRIAPNHIAVNSHKKAQKAQKAGQLSEPFL